MMEWEKDESPENVMIGLKISCSLDDVFNCWFFWFGSSFLVSRMAGSIAVWQYVCMHVW